MGFFDNLKQEWADRAEKRKEEEAIIRRLQVEAAVEKNRVFEEEYRKNIFEIAIGKAKKEAAEKSGLKKLRATNRVRNLKKLEKNPTGFLSKLSEYTQRNMVKTEERKERTAELQKALEEEKAMRTGGLNTSARPIQRSYFG